MNQLSLGVMARSVKENARLPLHPQHLGGIPDDLRASIYLERGYGDRFGISDHHLKGWVAGFRTHEQLIKECDVILQPKPLLSDIAELRVGQILGEAWFDAGLGGSAQQVSPAVAEAAFQAGNGLQLGLDVAWDLFLAIGTAMLAWNMGERPRFGRAYAATGLLLAVALLGLNLAAFPETPGGLAWWMWARWSAGGTCGSPCGWRPRCAGPRTIAGRPRGPERAPTTTPP